MRILVRRHRRKHHGRTRCTEQSHLVAQQEPQHSGHATPGPANRSNATHRGQGSVRCRVKVGMCWFVHGSDPCVPPPNRSVRLLRFFTAPGHCFVTLSHLVFKKLGVALDLTHLSMLLLSACQYSCGPPPFLLPLPPVTDILVCLFCCIQSRCQRSFPVLHLTKRRCLFTLCVARAIPPKPMRVFFLSLLRATCFFFCSLRTCPHLPACFPVPFAHSCSH